MAKHPKILRLIFGREEDIGGADLWVKSTRLSDIREWEQRARDEGLTPLVIAAISGTPEDPEAKACPSEKARLFALWVSRRRTSKTKNRKG